MGNLMIMPSVRRKDSGELGELSIISYTGEYEIRDNGEIRFLTSGSLVLANDSAVDVFCVGGGASGSRAIISYTSEHLAGSGGAGGYTKTKRNVIAYGGVVYPIVVGDGGIGTDGAASSALGVKANGGKMYAVIGNPAVIQTPDGGSGGGGYTNTIGGIGGTDGGDGTGINAGKGQGRTTRAFEEENGEVFADGGAGGTSSGEEFAEGGENGGGGANPDGAVNGMTNTGGGGAGGSWITRSVEQEDGLVIVETVESEPGNGGSGIVIIRGAVR